MSPLVVLAGIRPVLLALLFRPLDLFRGHHNHTSILLPYHAPEVHDCVGQTSLGRDVSFANEVVVFLRIRHRRHRAEVTSNRGQRLVPFMLVVVSAPLDGTLNTHLVQLLAVGALAVVVAKRCV